ncbi:MAG: BspA family leucine-rich repeat surface protein, partial [Methylococcales symbiont of Iophon sp. n. MRB-2018]
QTATNQTGDATCVYAAAGTYRVSITGDFPHFYGNIRGNIAKLYNISQWGNIAWVDFLAAFDGASNLGSDVSLTFASDDPNLSNVTNMSFMFRSAFAFNQDIGNWNTANVTNMSNMFYEAVDFNS